VKKVSETMDTATMDGFTVIIRNGNKQLTIPFWTGYGATPRFVNETPAGKAADVLSCLLSDARSGQEGFEEFCSGLGYDPDSRRAEATWKACQEIEEKLSRFLTDEQREELEACEH
jgi:hypothetical protein